MLGRIEFHFVGGTTAALKTEFPTEQAMQKTFTEFIDTLEQGRVLRLQGATIFPDNITKITHGPVQPGQ